MTSYPRVKATIRGTTYTGQVLDFQNVVTGESGKTDRKSIQSGCYAIIQTDDDKITREHVNYLEVIDKDK